ncbi:MAG: glycine--tRNA ligase [Phycisphaerae bacterium]|nr:glycine--tRNA ligase [Phycisphaerae bacterium]
MENLTALCKRRGFIFQSSEIYGGIGGFWDYGPLGVELKKNIKDTWWRDMVTNAPDGPDGKEVKMVGLDCSIIMNPAVWKASGHVGGFSDPMVDCKECKARYRADQLFVRKERTDTGANLMYAFVAGDEDSLKRAQKQLDSYLRKEQRQNAQLHTKPLLDIPTTEYSRVVGPDVKTAGTLTEPRAFNLMFQTYVGALQDASSVAYLRPETAQGIFANFMNVMDTSRVKVPFGIAQIGKSFRNEINPRNYTFRSREFEQMEIEFFCHEADSMKWYEFWRNVRFQWYVNLGLKSEKLRLRDQKEDELAHYSKACADIEYLFPFSDEHQELEGVAHRGNYDLTQHQEHSGKDLTYFDDDAWERDKDNHPKDQHKEIKNKPPYRFLPTVIEPSAGADRATLAFLCEAYTEDQAPDDKGNMQTRTVMKFHPRLAPVKVAVFPLVNKEGMPDIAEQIYRDARQHMTAFYDVKGAIGRRYRRQDEVGTPFCVTVDGDTLSAGTVTIRNRDTLEQVRVPKENVVQWLQDHLRR